MDVEEAKFRLEMARYKLNGCEGHLDRANREWADAEASRWDNKRYYRLQRTLGNGYMKQRRDANDSARREWESAREELEKAEADYEKALKG